MRKILTLGLLLLSALPASFSYAQASKEDEKIVREYEALVAKEPDNAQYSFTLGVAYAKVNRPLDAVASLEVAAQKDPDDADIKGALALMLEQVGQMTRAVSVMQSAVRMSPTVERRFDLARMLRKAKRSKEAIDQLKKIVAQKPKFAAAFFNLGEAYEVNDQIDEAIAAYKSDLARARQRPGAHQPGQGLWRSGLFQQGHGSVSRRHRKKSKICGRLLQYGRGAVSSAALQRGGG